MSLAWFYDHPVENTEKFGMWELYIHFAKMSLCMDQLYETCGSRGTNVSIREKAGSVPELTWMQWQK
jgi:hypothetical protein